LYFAIDFIHLYKRKLGPVLKHVWNMISARYPQYIPLVNWLDHRIYAVYFIFFEDLNLNTKLKLFLCWVISMIYTLTDTFSMKILDLTAFLFHLIM